MNTNLLKNEKFIIIATIFMIIVLFTGIYFFILYPKAQKIDLKETELHSQEQLLSTFQSQMTDINSNTFEKTVTLQKMVPVKPLSQQLLLQIEKAEVISGSFVLNMAFEDSEVEIELAQEEQSVNEAADIQNENGEEKKDSSITLPTGVHKITATLSIESPSYFEFEEFISILEHSERIIVIESIEFEQVEEIIEVQQKSKPLSYQVILSAFYMPTLTDLMDRLPKLETPEPAQKKNPLPSFGELNAKSETRSWDDSANKQNSKHENSSFTEKEVNPLAAGKRSEEYIVKSGDTLFNLAIKFYNSNIGMGIIKEANSLKGNKIYAGQKLLIPAPRY